MPSRRAPQQGYAAGGTAASGIRVASAASAFASNRTGAVNSVPPWTIRCPAAISFVLPKCVSTQSSNGASSASWLSAAP